MSRPNTPARQHADWLGLVEPSGPFLSLPVLLKVFPQGLPTDTEEAVIAAECVDRQREWSDAAGGRTPDIQVHRAWVTWVLTRVLDWPTDLITEGQSLPPGMSVRIPNEGVTLQPTYALLDPDDRKPAMLVVVESPKQKLDAAMAGSGWKASPLTRMIELLKGSGVPLGLLTNGKAWMLVSMRAGEPTGTATWDTEYWREERVLLRSFRALLGVSRVVGVAPTDRLATMLADSAKDQADITDQLGRQVRDAVEVLIQRIDAIDRARDGALLQDIEEGKLYESALAVMMRLVFLFNAEERGMLLLGEELWDLNYSVSTLGSQLRAEADAKGEEILERRQDAWSRLLATFRAVYGGIDHDRMRLRAYGGGLFHPDRYPFLEGRPKLSVWTTTPAVPLPIDNRTVLHLLDALQYLEMEVPGGGREKRKLSFKSLDVENIGQVYEGLLDHTVRRATEPMLGLRGKGRETVHLPLSVVEAAARKQATLDKLIKDHELKKPDRRAANSERGKRMRQRLPVACGGDEALVQRVLPFVDWLDSDTRDDPVVILTGGAYVGPGPDRRSTGTHYTPRTLTEDMVRHALDPLVYAGMADGVEPSPETLKGPDDILALRVVDFACGSGAFLVQACRFLSEMLVEGWARIEAREPGRPLAVPDARRSAGDPTERLLPTDPEERLAIARRLVVERCLYGVDCNPMAIEMAKLSLWLITAERNRAFEFLDHALKVGDSLLGLWDRAQLEAFHIDPVRVTMPATELHEHKARDVIRKQLAAAAARRRELEAFPVRDVSDAEAKARMQEEVDTLTDDLRLVGDCIVGAALEAQGKAAKRDDTLMRLAEDAVLMLDETAEDGRRRAARQRLRHAAQTMLNAGRPEKQQKRKCLHWCVEFPDIIDGEGGGFHAVLGNPPFKGGKLISGIFGQDMRQWMIEVLAEGRKGHADICAYFFLRAGSILHRHGGGFALIATNTIAEGDTRDVGLEAMLAPGLHFVLRRAETDKPWPGTANLNISIVWGWNSIWRGKVILNGGPVSEIDAFLDTPGRVRGKPLPLKANEDKSFIGSYVLGEGFLLPPEEARRIIAKNPKYREVLFPYFVWDDVVSRPDQSAPRWIINFFDWPWSRRASGAWENAESDQREAWLRKGIVPADYPGPVALDFPICAWIIRNRVRPERTRKDARGDFQLRYPLFLRWWQYADKRPALQEALKSAQSPFVCGLVTEYLAPLPIKSGSVFSHKCWISPTNEREDVIIIHSDIHEYWARKYSSSMKTWLNYSPSDCFENFPFPEDRTALEPLVEPFLATRNGLCRARNIGLTDLYNLFHNKDCHDPDIVDLRQRQVEANRAVADAYGWQDLELDYDFRRMKWGPRYAVSDRTRREILDRLLELNLERRAAEEEAGLWDKPDDGPKPRAAKKTKKPKKANPAAATPDKPLQREFDLPFQLTPPPAGKRK